MKNVKDCLHPKSLKEAIQLAKKMKNAQYISGGTAFRLHPNDKVEYLINLSKVLPSKITKKATSITVSAGTSLQDICASKAFSGDEFIVLRESARTVGGLALRNQITVGGNTVMKYPWSNLPLALLVLGARFKVTGSKSKTMDADTFLMSPKAKTMSTGDILTEVEVPIEKKLSLKTHWFRFGYTTNDIPIFNMAISLGYEKKKAGRAVTRARIAVGALTGLPCRLKATEKLLETATADVEITEGLAAALKTDADALKFISDIRVNRDYQRNLIIRKARREILTCLGM